MSDLLVDETGAFQGLEVSRGHPLVGMRSRHSVVRASEQIRIGPHVVVVPNDTLEKDLGSDTARTHHR